MNEDTRSRIVNNGILAARNIVKNPAYAMDCLIEIAMAFGDPMTATELEKAKEEWT